MLKIIHKCIQLSPPLQTAVSFIPAHHRLLYGVRNPFLENRPITANFAHLEKLIFDLYDQRTNVSRNMAGIEVGFVDICEKFGIMELKLSLSL